MICRQCRITFQTGSLRLKYLYLHFHERDDVRGQRGAYCHKCVELYDTRCGKLSFYCTCKAGKHVKGRVLQVIRLSNEGGGEPAGEACYHLGSLLSHKQAILVSQTRGRFVTIVGSCHETSTNCQYVSSRPQCS